MKKERKPNKPLTAALALLLIASSILIAGASSASRRTSKEVESESVSSTKENRLPLESMIEKLTGTAAETTVPESESVDTESEEASISIENIVFITPVSGAVISPCSLTAPVYSLTMNDYRTHCGIDISASVGESVSCCADGVIKKIENDPMMGMSVTVDHGGDVESVYRNLSPELAEGIVEGCTLSAGDVIGAVGESALVECEEECHLHLELKVGGQNVDPAEYIALSSVSEVYEDEID